MSQNHKTMSRRQALVLLGTAGAAILAGHSTAYNASAPSSSGKLPACIVTPKQTEGPFFIDERLNRSDIRVDPSDGSLKAGVPLSLTLRVSTVGSGGCNPLSGAIVDVWHCDAAGAYSAVNRAWLSDRREKFSARVSTHQSRWQHAIHNDLPRVVSRQNSAHSF